MSDIILPSKLVGERITVRFDFNDVLDWGETITSQVVQVSVVSGTDGAPSALLYRAASSTNNVVSQQIQLGVPGVIYKLTCRAVGSTSQLYAKETNLAILPDGSLNPPIIGTYFTSRPYPVEMTDFMHSEITFVSGRVQPQPFPTDYIQSDIELMSVSLFGSAEAYSFIAEGIQSTIEFQEGSVYGTAEAYSMLPEGISVDVIVMAANLYGAGVAHSILPEGVQTTISFISGSLA